MADPLGAVAAPARGAPRTATRTRSSSPATRTSRRCTATRSREPPRVLRGQPRGRHPRSACPPDARAAFDAIAAFQGLQVSRTEGATHDRLRRIAHRAFTPRRIADMEASIAGHRDALLDAASADDVVVDLMTFAYRLPLLVISDMLGVTDAREREAVRAWGDRIARHFGSSDSALILDAHRAVLEFRAYVERVIERHRAGGRDTSDDLVSALMDAEGDERLTQDELAAMFVVLLFAGHETTTNLIAIGMLDLLQHPEQWRRLTADPGLTERAVEELLRRVTPVQWEQRVVVEELEIGEEAVPRGQTVFTMLAGANRDPAVFARPEELDVGREDARRHLELRARPALLPRRVARPDGGPARLHRPGRAVPRPDPGRRAGGDRVPGQRHDAPDQVPAGPPEERTMNGDPADVPLAELVSLGGRVAVVTGAAQGLGFAIARRFAEAGADLVLADLDGGRVEAAAQRLADEHGVRAAGEAADMRDRMAVEALAERADAELGGLDVWVNNAGVYPRGTGFEISDDQWDLVLDLNLRGSFLGCRAAGRRMVAAGRGGVILNVASTAGHRGFGPGLAHYVSSKHGVLGLTKSFAVELGPHRIRVLALSPTSVPTEGVAAARAAVAASADAREAEDVHPLAASRSVDHVARVALFCASDLAALVTGSAVLVDAGLLSAGLVDRRYEAPAR